MESPVQGAVPDYPVARPPTPRPENGSATRPPEYATASMPPPVPASGSQAPVARPAQPKSTRTAASPPGPAPRIAGEPEPQAAEELLPPTALKGWVTSIILHAVFLLVLGLWFFSPRLAGPKIIDTRLAGSEFGDESGTQLTGSLGMDTPLAMPEVASAPELQTPVITSLPSNAVALDPSVIKLTAPAGASNGGGTSLTNPGQAGSGDGFGVARFGHGGENINGVTVKVGDPQFTLIWNSKADLDLHVKEPGGSEIYWESRNGDQGGELDVDDVDGFGPENVYWGGGLDKGNGPPGEYKWFVHYYGGLGGIAVPTRWKVRLKHDGKITTYEGKLSFIGEKSKTYSFKVGDSKGSPKGDTAAVEKK